ncbi:MAG: HEAT repeat domain-containing protein [Planctomycetota bacterium]|nr:HEAT repeat domain-containing protein [Planctomycetota bacterium]
MRDSLFRSSHPILGAALLLGIASGPILAQEAAQEAVQEATAEESRDAKDLERILTLSSGMKMRTRARLDGSAWMVRRGSDWFPMPASSIVEQQPVKDILKEAKKRERKLKMALADDRADQAMWLSERGLHDEALEHLEVALRKDPDHAPSLTLITSGHVPMRLPAQPEGEPGTEAFDASLEAYLAQAAAMQRASREAALAGLEAPTEALIAAFTRDLSSKSSARRILAAHGLQRLVIPALAADLASEAPAEDAEPGPSALAVQSLLDRSVLDGSDEVRASAARALRDLDEPSVTQPLIQALGSKSTVVRANAAESLGVIAQPIAVPALVSALAATAGSGGVWQPPARHIFVGRQIAYVQDYDVEGFTNAVAADPQISVLTEGAVLDVRLLSLRQELARTHERSKLRGALRHMTGKDFKYDAKRWDKWLAENPLE